MSGYLAIFLGHPVLLIPIEQRPEPISGPMLSDEALPDVGQDPGRPTLL